MTGFTAAHSITLSLAALDRWRMTARSSLRGALSHSAAEKGSCRRKFPTVVLSGKSPLKRTAEPLLPGTN